MILSLKETSAKAISQKLERLFKDMIVYDFGGQDELLTMLIHLFPHLKFGSVDVIDEAPNSGLLVSDKDQTIQVYFGSDEVYSLDSAQQRYTVDPDQLELDAVENRDLFNDLGFRFKVENSLVVCQENHIHKVLFHLNDNLIERREKFGSILAILVMTKLVNADVFEYNERLTSYLLRRETRVFKDVFTKIEFADFSQIHTNEDLIRVLRYTHNDSIIVLGGKISKLPGTICEKIVQKKCQLVLLDLFGAVDLGGYEEKLSPLRVPNVKEAVDAVYMLAENPSRICVFPCMYMAETISGVMSRKFELEVSLC